MTPYFIRIEVPQGKVQELLNNTRYNTSNNTRDNYISSDVLDDLSPKLQKSVRDWFQYKKEKRQAYKPMGREKLIVQIRNNAAQYGDDAVADVIDRSISCNYHGIVWDWLQKGAAGKPGNSIAVMGFTPGDGEKSAVSNLQKFRAEIIADGKDST